MPKNHKIRCKGTTNYSNMQIFRQKNGVPRFSTRHTFEKIYSKYSRRVSFLFGMYICCCLIRSDRKLRLERHLNH